MFVNREISLAPSDLQFRHIHFLPVITDPRPHTLPCSVRDNLLLLPDRAVEIAKFRIIYDFGRIGNCHQLEKQSIR